MSGAVHPVPVVILRVVIFVAALFGAAGSIIVGLVMRGAALKAWPTWPG